MTINITTKFHLSLPNEYGKCPKCGEWSYYEGYCKDCGYSVD